MQELNILLSQLKQAGHRLTKIRRAILDLLLQTTQPLSCPELRDILTTKGLRANKTTIYRELAFLKKQNLILELQLGENIKRYEIASKEHHHHLVCLNCEMIEEIILDKDLKNEEKNILADKGFQVLNHYLEFFGLCKKCQT